MQPFRPKPCIYNNDMLLYTIITICGVAIFYFASQYCCYIAVILAVGVKESTLFNNLFTGLNLLVVLYAVICGAFKADGSNWALSPHTSIVKVSTSM